MSESHHPDSPSFKGYQGFVTSVDPLRFTTPILDVPLDVIMVLPPTQQREAISRLTWAGQSARVDANTARDQANERVRDAGTAAVAEFKTEVARVAMEYARRNDWCDEVKRALTELEITPPSRDYKGSITLTINFQGTYTGDRDTIDAGFLASSVKRDDSYSSEGSGDVFGLHLDDDFTNVTFDYQNSMEVTIGPVQ